jgi:hypothetical protein
MHLLLSHPERVRRADVEIDSLLSIDHHTKSGTELDAHVGLFIIPFQALRIGSYC